MLYRKKAIAVKAEQWFPDRKVEGVHRIPANVVDLSQSRGIKVDRPARYVCNHPREGQIEVFEGDWIVTDPNGGYYPVRQGVFHLFYEPITLVSAIPLHKRGDAIIIAGIVVLAAVAVLAVIGAFL